MIHSKLALLFVLASPTASVFGQTPVCTTAFDAICSEPSDIDPILEEGQCNRLPDCPSWCADADYCGSTTLIDGSTVKKYAMEFFPPPVIVNRNGDKNTIAVREFLQPILPDYPKTRLWGYGKCYIV